MNGRLGSSEHGQVAVMVAVGVLFMMGMLAIVGDASFVWMQRRNLQNSADAAALAAAQNLPENRSTAETVARDYAKANISGITDADIDVCFEDGCTVEPKPLSVRVTVRKMSESLFGVSLGFGKLNVSAKARTKVKSVSNLIPCVQPLGVKQSTWAAGVATETDQTKWVEIKIGFVGGSGGSNNTGLLDLIKISDDIAKGACHVLKAKNDTDPGNKLGEVIKGFQDRLSAAHNRPGQECYSETAVRTYVGCRPELMSSTTIQPTALVLVPILDPNQNPVNDLRGKKDVPLWEVSPGNYRLAYFWVDGNKTFKDKTAGKPLDFNTNQPWECQISDGSNKCVVFGRFVSNLDVRLDVLGCPTSTPNCLIDFDPSTSLIKFVQLVE